MGDEQALHSEEAVLEIPGLTIETGSLLAAAPAIGSFLGVLIRRLPEGRLLVMRRSQCESCHAILSARDLVPVLSWLVSAGRCRRCGSVLGYFYPGVELAALAIAVIAVAVDGMPRALLDCVLGWWLLALSWIDLRCWLLPDALTLPLIVAGLAVAVPGDPAGLIDRVFGAALGYLLLQGIAAAYRQLRKSEGLGAGDAKLLAAAGAWVGATALPQLILAAASGALIVAALLRLWGVRLGPRSALPFGPFIAIASWCIWLFGTKMF